MSTYTSIILYIPALELKIERIREVNLFKTEWGNSIDLLDINEDSFPDLFPRFVFAGRYKSFRTDLFLEHLIANVKWEYPEFVRVIICEENEDTTKMYSIKDRRWLT